MMGASHDEAQMDVPQAHESVDSRGSIAGGRQMSTAELAPLLVTTHTGSAPGAVTGTVTAPAPRAAACLDPFGNVQERNNDRPRQ